MIITLYKNTKNYKYNYMLTWGFTASRVIGCELWVVGFVSWSLGLSVSCLLSLVSCLWSPVSQSPGLQDFTQV